MMLHAIDEEVGAEEVIHVRDSSSYLWGRTDGDAVDWRWSTLNGFEEEEEEEEENMKI